MPALRYRLYSVIITARRRVSAMDLGSGQHEGWLFTKKKNKTNKDRGSWDKFRKWCVLKDSDFYVFNSKMVSINQWENLGTG